MYILFAGCEYGGYSSDITRTWPINGNFTKSQEILYEIVHFTQRGIHLAAENAKTFALDDLFELMCSLLGKYLQDIVKADKLHEMGTQRQIGFRFCPHHVSHYLGMDIHDTPLIKRSSPVEPGMVFTIEPGMIETILFSSDKVNMFSFFRTLSQAYIFHSIVKRFMRNSVALEFVLKTMYFVQKIMVLKI